jgi:ribonucleoside-diphosphate reductase alpha chain
VTESTEHVPATTITIKNVIKRDGRVVEFRFTQLVEAIFKAAEAVGGKDKEKAVQIAHDIMERLQQNFKGESISAEKLQDLIERSLIENGHVQTAKSYILGQHKKQEVQIQRSLILGKEDSEDNLNFSNEALRILERRYLLKDTMGNLIETPKEMIRRVAQNIAYADSLYKSSENEIEETEEKFYYIMSTLRFLPNSPTLKNAATKTQQLSSCFVLPLEDDMESIFGSLHDAAVIHQRGAGTGFSFSKLRAQGSRVRKNLGVAAGPVAFMRVYDAALDVVKQGGIRPGANMAILRVDHPDILRFIEVKRDQKTLKNFNISVGMTDNFMKAVEQDRQYYINDPHSGKSMGLLRARDVFAVITQNAWKTGDPGLVFLDEINKKHPAKHLGEIETTNQCGEAPLLPYEGCALGSINLTKFVDEAKGDLNWEDLKETIETAVHFLDNVIDMNSYPKKEIEVATKHSRKFGLGIMGFADILCTLRIKYDSEAGLEMGDKLMSFIKETCYTTSQELATKRGVCGAWEGSEHQKAGRNMRNMTCNSLSPTGTISILASASSGCEPLFAISYQKTVLGDNEIIYLNKTFERVAKERGFYSPELIRKISKAGTVQGFKEIPKDVREIFVTAQDIDPVWHVKMQATLQRHVDNSISKTINFPNTASIRDVEEAYLLAWKSKCKGITIYRDGSYEEQVINIGG